METKDKIAKVRNRVPRIHKLLRELPPEVQGAILADLLATWLAGHAPALRQLILEQHIKMMIPLISVNEDIMFGEAGHPATRSSSGTATTRSSEQG